MRVCDDDFFLELNLEKILNFFPIYLRIDNKLHRLTMKTAERDLKSLYTSLGHIIDI